MGKCQSAWAGAGHGDLALGMQSWYSAWSRNTARVGHFSRLRLHLFTPPGIESACRVIQRTDHTAAPYMGSAPVD